MAKQPDDAKFNADAQIKLETAHDILQRPDKFAETFINAANTQTCIKELIKSTIHDSLALDPESRTALKKLIKEQLDEDWKNIFKTTAGKIGFGLWTLLTLALGVWLTNKFGK